MDGADPIDRSRSRTDLAARLSRIRRDCYGENGCPELARQLGVPCRTWMNYESGVSIPGEVLLAFIVATGVEPLWLLRGGEPIYRRDRPASRLIGY